MALTPPALKSPAHPMPEAASFSLGQVSFTAPLARKATASRVAMIDKAMFIRILTARVCDLGSEAGGCRSGRIAGRRSRPCR
jgi:hypothetical protein